jgi:hypothetical protein
MAAARSAGLSEESAYRLYGRPIQVGDAAHLIETDGTDTDTSVISVYRHGERIELTPGRELE